MPGRRDFLGVASAALAVAAAGGLPGCARAARAGALATPTASLDATLAAAGRLFRAGDFAQADALYEQVLGSDPANPQALAQHGYAAMLANRLPEARGLLQRALRGQPGNQQAAQNLADTVYRLNDFAAAAAAYRRLGPGTAPMARMLASFGDTAPYQLYGPDATRLPFLRTSPLPMVSISVNGSAPVPVHLDTGAPVLSLDPSYAASIGVTAVASGAIGWGRADRVTLGDIEIRDVPVSLAPLPLGNLRAPDGQADHGVLGLGLLAQFLFTMDYAGGALELRRPGPAAAAPAGGDGSADAVSLPFWMAGDHFMVTWGSVNSRRPRLLIIDTGGENTGLVLSAADAAAAGITLDKKNGRRVTSGIVNGKVQYATAYQFTVDRLALGAAADCGLPGGAITPLAAPDFGFATGGRVSHSFFLPFAATYDFSSMRLSLRGSAASCGTGTGSYRS
jgi:predicted aspartyl protease